MRSIRIIFFLFALLLIFNSHSYAASKIAFGYLANRSKDANFNYLESVFPNSFANSIKNLLKIKVLKPQKINKILASHNIKLKKDYQPYELADITDIISSDYFIYGNFTTLPDSKIKIVINLYFSSNNKIFTFTNTGKMEKAIFKLVDRITQIFINFLGEQNLFISENVPKGSTIAILTNIDGDNLNSLYYSFLRRGYNLAGMNGNTLYNYLTEKTIDKFRFILTNDNSYDIITDRTTLKFISGTWASEKYNQKLIKIKKIYKKYDYNYLATKNNILNRLEDSYKIDALLIIGFNRPKNSAWARCINIKDKKLILMQSNIKGSDISEIGSKISGSLIKKPKKPKKPKKK